MKAKLVESSPSSDWIYETKLDGYRALALPASADRSNFAASNVLVDEDFSNNRSKISRIGTAQNLGKLITAMRNA